MKKIFIFLCLLSLLVTAAFCSTASWSSGTAYTLPKGRWEIGLFQPLRYGQSEKLEWSTHPIFDLLIPNLTVKISRSRLSGWDMATRHSLVYPTPLLRIITRKGIGGIMAPDPTIPKIPHMISSRNEVILTKPIGPSLIVSGKAGITFALKTGELDERTTIDLPIVFPRLGAYYSGFAVNAGADIIRRVTKRMDYLSDMDLFLIPGIDENFFFEHKGLILWNKSDRFQVAVGYKLTYGKYPFGTQWHLIPLIDLQWARIRG